MLTNADCTVYNKTITAGAESWSSRQVTAVLWQNEHAARVTPFGTLAADSVTVYIATSHDNGTINEGDILVKGKVSDVVGPSFTPTQLLAKYPAESFTVRSVDRIDFGSKARYHRKVSGS